MPNITNTPDRLSISLEVVQCACLCALGQTACTSVYVICACICKVILLECTLRCENQRLHTQYICISSSSVNVYMCMYERVSVSEFVLRQKKNRWRCEYALWVDFEPK